MSQRQSYNSQTEDSFVKSSVKQRSNLDFYNTSFNSHDSSNANINFGGKTAQDDVLNKDRELNKSHDQLSNGYIAAFGWSGYTGEQSLLEELDINLDHIKAKSLIVLNPFSHVNQHIMEDSDLAGPLIFCVLFGTFLLLSGKVHFDFIYGLALLGSIGLHWILKMMSPNNSIDFIRTASVLGYSLLPMVLMSAIAIIVNFDNFLGYVLSLVAILWCTHSASSVFVSVLQLSDMRALVVYPLTLFYGGFAILSVFSE